MTGGIECEEVCANVCSDEFGELEVEVIAVQHEADCPGHSGCAGAFLILIIAAFGSLVFLF